MPLVLERDVQLLRHPKRPPVRLVLHRYRCQVCNQPRYTPALVAKNQLRTARVLKVLQWDLPLWTLKQRDHGE